MLAYPNVTNKLNIQPFHKADHDAKALLWLAQKINFHVNNQFMFHNELYCM